MKASRNTKFLGLINKNISNTRKNAGQNMFLMMNIVHACIICKSQVLSNKFLLQSKEKNEFLSVFVLYVSAAMVSESIMSCRCLLLAALALHCAAWGVASEAGSTEVSAGVAADADHQQHDHEAGSAAAAEWQLPTLDKRAYYVSEYKRLPVYNFGLGKRSPEPAANRYYAFGLGKRERGAGSRQYSFGLGKRPNNLYSFGLGKRSMEYNNAPDNAVSLQFKFLMHQLFLMIF
jgi:hypothetical protein